MNDILFTPIRLVELEKLIENSLRKVWEENQKGDTITYDRWLSLTELCEYLPDKPSKATIYGWVHFKKIPYYKKGKALFFKKSEIDRWLQEGSKNSTFEPTNVLKQKK